MVFLSLTPGKSHGLLLSLLSLLSSMPSLDAGYFIPAFSLSASCLGWTSWSSKPPRNHCSILWLKPNNAFPCSIPLRLACLHQYLAFSPSPSKLLKVGVSRFLVSLFINTSKLNFYYSQYVLGSLTVVYFVGVCGSSVSSLPSPTSLTLVKGKYIRAYYLIWQISEQPSSLGLKHNKFVK